MARGMQFRNLEVEGLYYPCRENKGADHLRGYREADLRLCFRICICKSRFSHNEALTNPILENLLPSNESILLSHAIHCLSR